MNDVGAVAQKTESSHRIELDKAVETLKMWRPYQDLGDLISVLVGALDGIQGELSRMNDIRSR